MKVIKEFLGVPDGEVHPRTYAPGDECPPELLEAAVSLGAVDLDGKAGQPAENKATDAAPENKAAPAAKKGRAK
jgi:hypothetical protein